jgi:tetratricopeptide (TPR) repeat protein
MLGQAIEVASALSDLRLEAEAQLSMARLRREEGDELAATHAFHKAVGLLEREGKDATALAAAELEEAQALHAVGERDKAEALLSAAARRIEGTPALALAARAAGVRGVFLESRGSVAEAAISYRQAADLAAEAGDGDGFERWRTAAGAAQPDAAS